MNGAPACPFDGPRLLADVGGTNARFAAGRTIGLIGPGTGLGVSGIVPVGGCWAALASEGSHVSFASAERLLSGPGIELICKVLSGRVLGAAAITQQAAAAAVPGAYPDLFDYRTISGFSRRLGYAVRQPAHRH